MGRLPPVLQLDRHHTVACVQVEAEVADAEWLIDDADMRQVHPHAILVEQQQPPEPQPHSEAPVRIELGRLDLGEEPRLRVMPHHRQVDFLRLRLAIALRGEGIGPCVGRRVLIIGLWRRILGNQRRDDIDAFATDATLP